MARLADYGGPSEGPGNMLNALAGNSWTCEFWLNLKKIQKDITIIDIGQGYNPGFTLKLTTSKNFEIISSYSGIKALCPSNIAHLTDEEWHHVAFTRLGLAVNYFLDGKQQTRIQVTSISRQSLPDLQKPRDREHEHRDFKSMTFDQRRQARFNITIGHQRRSGHIMKGMVDELRFSDIIRYSKNFRLPASLARKFGAYNANPSKPAVPGDLSLLFGSDKPAKQASHTSPIQFGLRKYLFTSKDGIYFHEHRESPVINETPLYGTFFKNQNPDIPDEERFKLTAWVGNRGIHLFLSPDGVHSVLITGGRNGWMGLCLSTEQVL